MCDRHKGKERNHYCLEHDLVICSQCASEEHAQTPCESMTLAAAAIHIAPKLEAGVAELRKLKSASQSIIDGRREDETIQKVNEVEAMIDAYVDEMKGKLRKYKASLRQFSELSSEERWKLQAIASRKIPTGSTPKGVADTDEARDMVERLQEVRKQTKTAEEALNALPNYVEVSINHEFLKSLAFNGSPIEIKRNGQTIDQTEAMDDDELEDYLSAPSVKQETVYLIEKSSFSLEHCTDVVIMSDYIVASVGDSVQKRDRKRMSFRQGITIKGAGKLGIIGETSEVSVMQKTGRISILETMPDLRILYSLTMNQAYGDVDYLESVQGYRGCPVQSPVFVVCYSDKERYKTEYVDLIRPKPTKYPGKPPTFSIEPRTIAESSYADRHRSRFRGITSLSVFQNRSILVGASKGVTCLGKTGTLIWTVDLDKQTITSVMSYRTLIFVTVKNERKIMTIGKQGHVIEENILPQMDLFPQKLSAYEDTLMVKQRGQSKWIIFKKMYEGVEH